MLDTQIFVALFFAMFFWIWGQAKNIFGLIAFSSTIFLILGIALFTTGWETFDNAGFLLQDVNNAAVLITPQILTFPVTLAENPGYFMLATIFLTLSFGLALLSFKTRKEIKEAKEEDN